MKTITEAQHQLIDRFFNNELKKEELPFFEQQMKEPAFQEMVRLRRDLGQVLRRERAKDPLMQLIQRESRKHAQAEATSTSPGTSATGWLTWLRQWMGQQRIMAYSLVAVFLVVLAGTWWANRHHSDHAIATDSYLPVYNDQQAGRAEVLLPEAKIAFFDNQYEEAMILLRQVPPGDAYYEEAQVLLAHAYFRTQRYAESLPHFDAAIESPPADGQPAMVLDKDALRWNRLLAHLGAGDTKAPQFLEALQFFSDHPSDAYRAKAARLKQRLGSPWRWFLLG